MHGETVAFFIYANWQLLGYVHYTIMNLKQRSLPPLATNPWFLTTITFCPRELLPLCKAINF